MGTHGEAGPEEGVESAAPIADPDREVPSAAVVPEEGTVVGPERDPIPSAREIDDDRTVAQKLVSALQRMVPSAKEVGLEKSAQVLTTAVGTIGYEAAGYRIPKCSGCGQPRSEDEVVRKINRDRA